MPAQDVYDFRHWRSRAEEMRVLAEGMNDIKTRRIVTRLADGWDKMADRAERRAAKFARYLDRNEADLHTYRRPRRGAADRAQQRYAAGPAATSPSR